MIAQNLNPEWQEFSVNLASLCGDSLYTAIIQLEVWDKDTLGRDLIGLVQVIFT